MQEDGNDRGVPRSLLGGVIPLILLILMSANPMFSYATDTELGSISRDPSIPSCTILSVALGEKVYFGNNEDYRHEPDELFISFVPPQDIPKSIHLPESAGMESIYGHVLVGDIMVIDGEEVFWPEGGMNDQGLCVDVNSIPPENLNASSGELWRPWRSNNDLLWVCSTVDEVVEWYQSHRLPASCLNGWNGQMHYADASGDSVIVVPNNGGFSFIEKGYDYYSVSTNFNRANVNSNLNGYPCWRYDTSVEMLSAITCETDLTVEACRDILDAVHLDRTLFSAVETLYSTVYDPVTREVYLYFMHDFSTVKVFNLEEELAKVDSDNANFTMEDYLVENTYLMQDLFPGYTPAAPQWVTYGLLTGGALLFVGALVTVYSRLKARRPRESALSEQ